MFFFLLVFSDSSVHLDKITRGFSHFPYPVFHCGFFGGVFGRLVFSLKFSHDVPLASALIKAFAE